MGLTETYQALIILKETIKIKIMKSENSDLAIVSGIGALIVMVTLLVVAIMFPKSLTLPTYTPTQTKVVKSPMAIPVKK